MEWVKARSKTQLTPHQGQEISLSDVLTLHELISQDVDETNNPPRQFRNNQPTQQTRVDDAEHGGTYRPPKCLKDIEYLMLAWVEWLNHPALLNQSALIRASLAHYYFEQIHPFWDGNGRTGRLIEMLILEQSGYRFSSSAVWKYYQENIHQYFSLFNQCRKLAEQKDPRANQNFVSFMTKGILETIDQLHDQSNDLIQFLLYKNALHEAHRQKTLSERQLQLIKLYMSIISNEQIPLSPSALYRKTVIQLLFKDKSERTYFRDVDKIVKAGFLKEIEGKLHF
jgi:Fic family protein